MKPSVPTLRIATILLCAFLSAAAVTAQPLTVRSRIIDFGTIPCGTQQCRTITFGNTGVDTISLSSIDFPSAPFVYSPAPPVLPLPIPPGDSLTFTLCYQPTGAGTDSSKSGVRYLVGANPVLQLDSFLLRGSATGGANLTVTPSPLDYGITLIGSQTCLSVTISNTGSSPATVSINGVNAPYSVQSSPPGPINPGSSASAVLCFQPTVAGTATGTAVFSYLACGATQNITVPLTGVGAAVPAPELGPVLQLISNPTNFDTTLCGTTKCQDLVFRNVGSSSLTVTSINLPAAPFALNNSTPYNLPFTLQPNEQRTFSMCYSPNNAPRNDAQTIDYVADNRVSLAIAMVFDVSGSMGIAIAGGGTRMSVANTGGKSFVARLLNDPVRGLVDTACITRFGQTIALAQDFTTNKALLSNNVPSAATDPATHIYDAVIDACNRLSSRASAGRRVIVLLTDGDDNGSANTLAQAIAAAQARGVRIFTIGVGSDLTAVGQSALQQLADLTGGKKRTVTNANEVIPVYAQIAQDLSKSIAGTFDLRGRSVAPLLTLSANALDFDSVRVGQSRCLPVVIGNTGDAPLVLQNIPFTAPFTVQNLPGGPIPPNGNATINVCFTPTRLRLQNQAVNISYNSCRPAQALTARGVGYDSVVVALTDTFRAKPGSIIFVPVYLRNNIPAEYEVDSMKIAVSYNKTMMFPLTGDSAIVRTGTLTSAMPTTTHSTLFEATDATTTFSFSGGRLVKTTADSVLVRLGFLVLHGNALTTPINFSVALLADGNPKTGRVQPGRLTADSLCYHPQRLIDASARIAAKIATVSVDPAGGQVMVHYVVMERGDIRLGIYNALGMQIGQAVTGQTGIGEYDVSFDLAGLAGGTYYCRLMSGLSNDVRLFTK